MASKPRRRPSITTRQAAEILGCSVRTVERKIKNGELHPLPRNGAGARSVRLDPDDVEAVAFGDSAGVEMKCHHPGCPNTTHVRVPPGWTVGPLEGTFYCPDHSAEATADDGETPSGI